MHKGPAHQPLTTTSLKGLAWAATYDASSLKHPALPPSCKAAELEQDPILREFLVATLICKEQARSLLERLGGLAHPTSTDHSSSGWGLELFANRLLWHLLKLLMGVGHSGQSTTRGQHGGYPRPPSGPQQQREVQQLFVGIINSNLVVTDEPDTSAAGPDGKGAVVSSLCIKPSSAAINTEGHGFSMAREGSKVNVPSSHNYVNLRVPREGSTGGSTIGVHRIMCWLLHGPPPSRMGQHHVRHMCNNRWCINPTHLQWGSPAENNRDREMQGHKGAAKRMRAAAVVSEQL